ncbi:MAG: hypothetical protein LLG04_14940 [Parachlamydia sp.]|nr:hypothetical protein [Parachlamydia sp.]
MTLTVCTVNAMFPGEPPSCGKSAPNRDGSRPITLAELTPKNKSLETTITTKFAESFQSAAEKENVSHLPCIGIVKMLGHAACCSVIRFINPIPFDSSIPQIFHVEWLRDVRPRQENIFYHQCGHLKYLLPVKKPESVFELSSKTIETISLKNDPSLLTETDRSLISRTLTCCLNEVLLKGVALTFEIQQEQMTILWLKA